MPSQLIDEGAKSLASASRNIDASLPGQGGYNAIAQKTA
jgi:hypothetical protein